MLQKYGALASILQDRGEHISKTKKYLHENP
jgi:hypothetical protein